MELKEAIPEVRIAIMKIEIDILKQLEADLMAMNALEPINFGFVQCTIAEYTSGREYEIKEIQK